MSDLDGFVRALNDAPADLALYGVFADWLEEKGGAAGGVVTYGPDFVYALRWCRGRKQHPLYLIDRLRWPWRWLRDGKGGSEETKRWRRRCGFCVLPVVLFDSFPGEESMPSCHAYKGWRFALSELAAALRFLRDVVPEITS